jgi:hypothetical protein
MQGALAIAHELVKFVGMLYIGQGLVRLLSFGQHERNPVYRLFRFLTSPVTAFVRWLTPRQVLDRHVPIAAFMLVFWSWLALIVVRRSLLLGA